MYSLGSNQGKGPFAFCIFVVVDFIPNLTPKRIFSVGQFKAQHAKSTVRSESSRMGRD